MPIPPVEGHEGFSHDIELPMGGNTYRMNQKFVIHQESSLQPGIALANSS